MHLLPQKKVNPMKSMLKLHVCLLAAMLTFCFPSVGIAGSVAGTGGATEVTQIQNNLQLVLQYEQQVQAYLRQGQQLQAELKNLIQNPASVMGSDVGNLINGVGRVMSGGRSIGGTMEDIDRNFATTFKSPTADTLARSFSRWNETSTDTLEGALKAIGRHRSQFATDSDAIRALYNESQATEGNLQALQTLSKINTKQLEQNQKLHDLLLNQHTAASTYMAAQVAKQNKTETDFNSLTTPYNPEIPPVTKSKAINWNNILFKK